MIRIQDSVPSIYYDSSRDFQLIGHLFDLVLNATKTDADLVFNLPFSINSNDQLLDLMAYTLGLRLSKEKYTSAQLRSICSVAFKMMRAKGSLKAVELLCTALIRADSISGSFSTKFNDETAELTVYVTNLSTCKDILHEILPYIVPAGIIFNIKEMSAFTAEITTATVSHQQVAYGVLEPNKDLCVPACSCNTDNDCQVCSALQGAKYSVTADLEATTYPGDLANVVLVDPGTTALIMEEDD